MSHDSCVHHFGHRITILSFIMVVKMIQQRPLNNGILILIFVTFCCVSTISINRKPYLIFQDQSQSHQTSVSKSVTKPVARNSTAKQHTKSIARPSERLVINAVRAKPVPLPVPKPASKPVLNKVPQNPCHNRPTPKPIPFNTSTPPTVFFLHIPKTGGTLLHLMLIRYAQRTNGLPCQFLADGNSVTTAHFDMSVKPPPQYPRHSVEALAVHAYETRNYTLKEKLYRRGACRSVRGHVTYAQRDPIDTPTLSVTVLRDPLDRFISMFEFVLMMMRTQKKVIGWENWLSKSNSTNLETELLNKSSILNTPFYDDEGQWIHASYKRLSFHFYGVLHQLSGVTPRFEYPNNPRRFRIANAKYMAEVAKNNICSTHILGLQRNMTQMVSQLKRELKPYINWDQSNDPFTQGNTHVNRNAQRKSRQIEPHGFLPWHREIQRRLEHEIDVYNFASRVVAYRQSLRQPRVV